MVYAQVQVLRFAKANSGTQFAVPGVSQSTKSGRWCGSVSESRRDVAKCRYYGPVEKMQIWAASYPSLDDARDCSCHGAIRTHFHLRYGYCLSLPVPLGVQGVYTCGWIASNHGADSFSPTNASDRLVGSANLSHVVSRYGRMFFGTGFGTQIAASRSSGYDTGAGQNIGILSPGIPFYFQRRLVDCAWISIRSLVGVAIYVHG